jgi:hypothetical protein
MLAWTQKKACQGNAYVSIDTKESMLRKISLTCHLLCPCWRMHFLIMPSFVFMLTYGFLYHAFFCVAMLTYEFLYHAFFYVSMDTKEGMSRKCIRQHRHKRRHGKEIHTSAWTQKKCLLLCPCWRMNFFTMPSFASMLTYAFPWHAFFCVHANIWISLKCHLLCPCWRMYFLIMPSFVSMLHGHKWKHVKEVNTSAWTQRKAC